MYVSACREHVPAANRHLEDPVGMTPIEQQAGSKNVLKSTIVKLGREINDLNERIAAAAAKYEGVRSKSRSKDTKLCTYKAELKTKGEDYAKLKVLYAEKVQSLKELKRQIKDLTNSQAKELETPELETRLLQRYRRHGRGKKAGHLFMLEAEATTMRMNSEHASFNDNVVAQDQKAQIKNHKQRSRLRSYSRGRSRI